MKLIKGTPEHTAFVEKLEEVAGMVDGGSLTSDYSGRCMYGKSCYGIDADNDVETLIQIGRTLGDLLDNVGLPKIDSMGRGVIVYWPNVEGLSDGNEG